MSIEPNESHTMQCMEVWGGNQAVDKGVVMPGIDLWMYCRPHGGDSAGGDVHYVSSCGTGRISRMVVADVSGHGAAAADVGAKLRALMRRYVNYVDPSRFMDALNNEFARAEELGCFATAVSTTYWAPTRYLVVSDAGHPRPLWYRARRAAWEWIGEKGSRRSAGPANTALGIVEGAWYEKLALRLQPRDLVLLYSDAWIEVKGTGGELLGEEGLIDFVRELDASRPEALIPALLERVQSFHGGAPPDDDATALLMRPNSIEPPRSLGDRLRSAGQFAKLVAASLAPGGPSIPWPEMSMANIGGALVEKLDERIGGRAAGAVLGDDDTSGPSG